jgi:hypothetical protein
MPAQEDYLKIREEQGEPTEFAEGFGIKAILAGLFVAFVVMPGSMFMWLMLGQQLGVPAVWVTLIIFLEVAKRCRTTLSRQEMFIIWSITWGVLGAAVGARGMNFIWAQYFVRSDAAQQFDTLLEGPAARERGIRPALPAAPGLVAQPAADGLARAVVAPGLLQPRLCDVPHHQRH